MVNVYNADRRNTKSNKFIFKHFGCSPIAAAERVEGMFSHQHSCSFDQDYKVTISDLTGTFIEFRTIEQHLQEFCNYAKTFSISEYALEVSSPLRLVDLWGDDPIGSGGPKVVESEQLTKLEQEEIQSIFAPFSDVIYPQQIYTVMSHKDIKAIRRKYSSNVIFKEELQKRKSRSKAIGEDFSSAQYQEIVWLDLTFKFKAWALNKGYDSFVYCNEKEGNGEDTYITLLPNQVKSTGKYLEFLEDKYLSEMPNIIRSMIDGRNFKSHVINYHVLWAQKDPMCYWG